MIRSGGGVTGALVLLTLFQPVLGAEAPPAWNVPGDVPEMMAACRDIPALYEFSRNGYLSIECGYQAILLGSRIPIAAAPHVPWARPYARGPIRVLVFCTFGNAPCDTRQVAQMARELDADLRFVLVADVPVHFDWARDDGYRLGYLAPQARAALKEPCDAIVIAMGSYSPGYGYPLQGPVFPDDVYQTLLEKVKAGAGLVLVGNNIGWVDKPLEAAYPATATGHFWRVKEPKITPGPDLDFLQGAPLGDITGGEIGTGQARFALYDWKLKDGTKVAATESGRPLVMVRPYGQGRVVLLGWDGTLAPVPSTAPRLEFEHGLATTLRAVAHAAKADPPVAVAPQPATLAAGRPAEATVKTNGAATLYGTVRDRQFQTLAEVRAEVPAGLGRLALPALPAGDYWLDVIARDARGASLGWGSAPVTVVSQQRLTLQTDKDVYRVGETVQVTGTLSGAPAGWRVEIAIRDAADRLLAAGPAPVAEGTFRFAYAIADARVAPHEVVAAVYDGQAPVLRQGVEFFVPNSQWTDYENILWPHSPAELDEQARDVAGLTAVMDGWGTDRMARAGARVGIRAARMNDGVLSPGDMQTKPAEAEKANEATLVRGIEAARKYGAVAWAMQDERHCTDDPGMPDAEGLKRYRTYLRTQYASLEALNASWGTAYKDWEEIKPTLTKDLTPETKNLAPWVDFRLYVADQVFQADRRHVEMIRQVMGEHLPVGIDGFTTSNHMIPYGATDIGRCLTSRLFNFYCPYGDDLMIASLVQGPMVKYIGWGMSRREYFGNPWRDAFRGQWGTFRFFGPTFFSDFGWVNPAGRWIEEGTRQLRAGVGKLLMGARRRLAPVAILYSYPSMMTVAGAGVWVEKGNAHLMWRPANWSREAWERMLVACGQSFGYVTTAQAEQGALKDKKLLILPHFMSMALSSKTGEAVKQFVADGGLVVADLAPAVCDEHGRLLPRGGLDDLFGVARESFAYAQRTADYLVGVTQRDPLVPPAAWYIGEWYEKNLKVTDGKALGKHWFQDVPALVAKQTGKGRALLLNFLHTSTVRRNGEPEHDDLRLMESILRVAGLQTPVLIETDYGKRERHAEVNTLVDGTAEYVGVYAWKMPSENPAKMVIRFPTTRPTYDVRGGRYLGRVDRAPLPLFEQEAALFARLDYEVEALAIQAASAQRGQAVTVELRLDTKAPAGRHVVHLEVFDPAGRRHFFYTRNVELKHGRAVVPVHTALNDPAGRWTIRAREVVSAKTAETTFQLR